MAGADEHNAAPGGVLWGRWAPLALAVAAVTVLLDQASKVWLVDIYDLPNRGRVYVTSFFDLVFYKNTGISYSLFSLDSHTGQLLLTAFAAVASVALWIWLNRPDASRLLALSLALIIGGAIGNGIDRMRLGGVADFASLHAFGYYWYVFNIADVAIVAGVVGLLYESFKGESH